MPPKWPFCRKCRRGGAPRRKVFTEVLPSGAVVVRCPSCGGKSISRSKAAARYRMEQRLNKKDKQDG